MRSIITQKNKILGKSKNCNYQSLDLQEVQLLFLSLKTILQVGRKPAIFGLHYPLSVSFSAILIDWIVAVTLCTCTAYEAWLFHIVLSVVDILYTNLCTGSDGNELLCLTKENKKKTREREREILWKEIIVLRKNKDTLADKFSYLGKISGDLFFVCDM